jgi:dihydrofolate reductase
MIISIIAALDEEGGIGYQNRLPWHLPGDLSRFKKLTMGHHLILGRKTYESIGGPLPGREMIILSRNPDYSVTDSQVASTLEKGLGIVREGDEKEVFVVGGAEIYQAALPLADRMYLTHVHTVSQADSFFPKFDQDDWLMICEQSFPADQDNPIETTFTCLIRKISP